MVSLKVDSLVDCDSLNDWFFFNNLDRLRQLSVDFGSGQLEGKLLSLGGHAGNLSEHAGVNLAERQG